MFTFASLISLLAISTSISATPLKGQPCSPITEAQLLAISPTMASCNATAQFASECRTAAQGAPFLNKGFDKYRISTVGEQAAILSLILFETGNLRFDSNHFPPPGRPGQGTRSLMMFPFVLQYALDTPSTHAKALALTNGVTDPNDPSISDDTKNAVRALVLGDELSFASAMWFYRASGPNKDGCPNQVAGLQAATVEGWEDYITQCIGTTATDDRKSGYLATLNVLSA